MEWYELYNIAERYMELINPTSPEKIIAAGQYLGLRTGSRVIDFGCGFGEPLALWADHYGITGIGIDLRTHAVERAQEKMARKGLSDRITIIQANAAEYEFEKSTFDAAVCMGASFIWNGFRPTLQIMKGAVKPDGRLLIAEPYLKPNNGPREYAERENLHSELELREITHHEGFDIEYLIRASDDDWAHYEATNWRGLIAWIEENPNHPERQNVIDWFRKTQDDYFRYGRDHLGFAFYILHSITY